MKQSQSSFSRPNIPPVPIATSRFTGDAVCAIAGIHQGAAQLLSGGVLGVLAVLPTVPDRNGSCDQNDSRGPSAEQLLVGEPWCGVGDSVSPGYIVAEVT